LAVSETTVLKKLARRIISLRAEKKWSQEVLAERTSIQRSYIADLERGSRNPSVRTLVKLANGLGVSVQSLFTSD
jgi:transcriptional regulator with XRE-family HTH domain